MPDPERRILAALDQAPAVVAVLRGPELRYAYMNGLYRGFVPGAEVGLPFGFHQGQPPEHRELALQVLREARPLALREVEVRLSRKGHAYFDVLMHPLRGADGAIDGVIIIGTDVTATVKLRRELQEHAERARLAEERLKALFELGPFVLVTFDAQGRILYTAGGKLAAVGRKPGDLVGVSVFDQYREDPALLAGIRRALAGETFSMEVQRPGGLIFEIHYRPVRNAAGAIDQVIGIGLDVTKRRRAEEERAHIQEKMLQAQKLESLGVLAGGIAHDFNNLLTVIQGNASVALGRIDRDHPARGPIEDIATAAQRAAALTRQMLAYSGKGRFEIRPLDLREHVAEMGSLLRTSIPRKITLRVEQPDELPAIQGDSSQIQQVVMNLVLNAAESMDGRAGEVLLRLAVEEVGPEGGGDLIGREALAPGKYVLFSVEDSGAGMDPQVQARIFDPFFTTKAAGRGLGLAAVLGIVRGHGGAIRIRSVPGRGTRFDVLLPAAGARASRPPAGDPSPAAGSGTILLVDDEAQVRSATARMLAALGYDVLEADDALHGLEIFRLRGGVVDAVLLDVSMPRLSGEEALRLLREIDPEVRVVLYSGYADEEVAARLVPLGAAAVLQKPFSREQLAAAIRSALAAD